MVVSTPLKMLVLPPEVMLPDPEPERLEAMMFVSAPLVIDKSPALTMFELTLVVVLLIDVEDF